MHCNVHKIYTFYLSYNGCSKIDVILLLCTLFVTILYHICLMYGTCLNKHNNNLCMFYEDMFKICNPYNAILK